MKKFLSILLLTISLTGLVHAMGRSPETLIRLRVEPVYVSPNGDDVQDQVYFSPILTESTDILRWRLEVYRSTGKRVARLNGAGYSALIQWHGRGDNDEPVADGAYEVQMRMWTKHSKIRSERKLFVIDTKPPQVSLISKSPVMDAAVLEGERMVFQTQAVDANSIDNWIFQVLDHQGRSVFIHTSTAPVGEIKWDGIDKDTRVLVPAGDYTGAFVAWDVAGNESLPAFAKFEARVSPKQMLKGVLKNVRDHNTDLGTLVQLEKNQLFFMKEGKPKLRQNAANILDEVSLLINAYPEADVRIEGFSQGMPTTEEDRNLSSVYAWRVYSYLVKNGFVKASRLTVRGRGRIVLPERRNVRPRVLQDGVEIIIENK